MDNNDHVRSCVPPYMLEAMAKSDKLSQETRNAARRTLSETERLIELRSRRNDVTFEGER